MTSATSTTQITEIKIEANLQTVLSELSRLGGNIICNRALNESGLVTAYGKNKLVYGYCIDSVHTLLTGQVWRSGFDFDIVYRMIFTQEALDLLKKLSMNRFWFGKLLDAVDFQSIDSLPIGREAIAAAQYSLISKAGTLLSTETEISSLSQIETAGWLLSGQLLFDESRLVLVKNPIFALPKAQAHVSES